MINKGSYTFYPVMESGNTDKVAYWQALWAGGHLGYFTTDGELMEHLIGSKDDKYMEPMMEQAARFIKEGLVLLGQRHLDH